MLLETKSDIHICAGKGCNGHMSQHTVHPTAMHWQEWGRGLCMAGAVIQQSAQCAPGWKLKRV